MQNGNDKQKLKLFIMSKLNQKLQLNKENIATLENMDQVYGGQDFNFTIGCVTYYCPSVGCPPVEKPKEKCTHSGCSCC